MQARPLISEAYDIRSLYVHGGHLSKSDKARHEKRAGTTLEALRVALLQYVRNIIMVYLFGAAEKDNLILMVDNSFLDTASELEIETALTNCKTFCDVRC